MGFWHWLGTVEGRSVRYPMIGVALIGLAALAVWFAPRGSPAARFDDGWVIVRPCGPIMCPAAIPGGERRVCGEYLLKRDPQGRYWRTNEIFRDEIDKNALDVVCPLKN